MKIKQSDLTDNKISNKAEYRAQVILLILLSFLFFFAEAYQYIYYVVTGNKMAAILFLFAYHIMAFLYGQMFFGDLRSAFGFVAVTAFLILMGDYSGFAPAAMLLHGLTNLKFAVLSLLVLLVVYVLIRLFILLYNRGEEQ